MIDPTAAFDTWLDCSVFNSEVELEAELARLFRRQKAIAAALNGAIAPDVIEEILYEDGIDPIAWATTAEDNLIYLLDQCPG